MAQINRLTNMIYKDLFAFEKPGFLEILECREWIANKGYVLG